MNSFELNKIAGAVLLAGIIAMAAGQMAQVLVPEPHGHGAAVIATPAGGGGPAPEAAPPAAAEPVLPLLAEASVEEGQKVARRCTACHTFEKGGANKVGPALYGVVGADKAHLDSYSYSAALASMPGEWTYEDLNQFLWKPSAFVPGTKMSFAGLSKVEDRANIIAYLRTLSDDPVPLPTPEEIAAVTQAAEGGEGTAGGEGGDEAAEPAAGETGQGEPAATESPAAQPDSAGQPAAQPEPAAPAAQQESAAPAADQETAAPASEPAAPAEDSPAAEPAEPAPADAGTAPAAERPSPEGTPTEIAPAAPATEGSSGETGAPASGDTPAAPQQQ